jgi:hypothetical protein
MEFLRTTGGAIAAAMLLKSRSAGILANHTLRDSFNTSWTTARSGLFNPLDCFQKLPPLSNVSEFDCLLKSREIKSRGHEKTHPPALLRIQFTAAVRTGPDPLAYCFWQARERANT